MGAPNLDGQRALDDLDGPVHGPQKPPVWFGQQRLREMKGGHASQNPDHVHFKRHRAGPASGWLKSISRRLAVGIAHLHHHARRRCPMPSGVGNSTTSPTWYCSSGSPRVVEQLAPHPLLHVGLRSPKGLALGQLERGACPFQAQQALLQAGESSLLPSVSVAGLSAKVLMTSPAGPPDGNAGSGKNPVELLPWMPR